MKNVLKLERLSQIKESKGSSYHKELENQEHIRDGKVDPWVKILNLIKLNARMNLKDIADGRIIYYRCKHLSFVTKN